MDITNTKHKPKILIADDEKSLATAINRFLCRFINGEYEPIFAHTGYEADNVLNTMCIDFAILDNNMKCGGPTGEDLANKYSSQYTGRIAVFTGDRSELKDISALLATGVKVFDKPSQINDICKYVAQKISENSLRYNQSKE